MCALCKEIQKTPSKVYLRRGLISSAGFLSEFSHSAGSQLSSCCAESGVSVHTRRKCEVSKTGNHFRATDRHFYPR